MRLISVLGAATFFYLIIAMQAGGAVLLGQKEGENPVGTSGPQSSTTQERHAEQAHQSATGVPPRGSGREMEDFHLKAGKVYEDLRLWKEAETEYLKVGSDAPSDTRRLALEGLRRVRSHPERLSIRFTRAVDSFGTVLLRVAGIAIALYLVVLTGQGLRRSNQRMEVVAFKSEGDDKLAGQVGVTFARVRAVISDTFSSDRIARSRRSGALNFPIVLPSLQGSLPFEEELPDVSLEAAGIKLSNLTRAISSFFRPRFRVVGGVDVTEHKAIVHAEIWERYWWFDYRLRAVRTREIRRPPNGEGLVELEEFVYDVLLNMPHSSPLATEQAGLKPPQPEAFRSFVEGVRRFRNYEQTDRGEDLQAAERAFSLAAQADPGFLLARFHQAVSLAHLRDHDKAIGILEDLSRWDVPFQAELHYNLSYTYFKKYDLESLQKAGTVLDEAERLAEQDKKEFLFLLARAMRVLLYAVMGGREANHPENFEERKKKYLAEAATMGEALLHDPRVLRLEPSQRMDVLLEVENGLGAAYMRLGDNAGLLGKNREEMWKKAEGYFRAALRIQPTNTAVLQNLGTLRRLQADSFREKGDLDAAHRRYIDSRDYFLKSLSINSLDQFPHYNVSICSAYLGDWETAEKYRASGEGKKGAVGRQKFEALALAIKQKDPKLLPAE